MTSGLDTVSTSSRDQELIAANQALAIAEEQVHMLEAELERTRLALAQAKRGVSDLRAVQLVEANEWLVLAALDAQGSAETAASELSELKHTSQRDVLTGTPNRALLLDRLESALALARRNRKCVAVLFLDIDHFKQINDSMGHATGDEVLQLVARRLESTVRDADTVCRYGGDEFLVLLSELAQSSDAALIARKMLDAIAEPCRVGTDQELHLTASLGIALFPEDGADAESLVRNADAAMYRAKRAGDGDFAITDWPAQL